MQWTRVILDALLPLLWRILAVFSVAGVGVGLFLFHPLLGLDEGNSRFLLAIANGLFALSISVTVSAFVAIATVRFLSKAPVDDEAHSLDSDFGHQLRRRFSARMVVLSAKMALGCLIVAAVLLWLASLIPQARSGGVGLDFGSTFYRLAVISGTGSAGACLMIAAATWQYRAERNRISTKSDDSDDS